MAEIIYTYHNQVYANITNICNCNCEFCVRSLHDGVGEASNLWMKGDPSLEEIKAAMDDFDFSPFSELVFCGYGEPTCKLDNLLGAAAYAKEKYALTIRLNTNGLANRYHGRNVVPELARVIDRVSISLNAPDAEKYQKIVRPIHDHAFGDMLSFADLAKEAFGETQLTIVDVLPREEIEACRRIADEHGISLRIRRFS
ncbi:MAG: TIGR04100 family radical SAM protein [Lachnospiraceae bacterium]